MAEQERQLSDREKAMAEIVADRKVVADAEAKESLPSVDDEGNVQEPTLEQAGAAADAAAEAAEEEETPAASEEETPPTKEDGTPSVPAEAALFDPNAEVELEVDGVKVRVPGSKLLDAGRRTLQKETAADFRLDLASRLLEEAKRKVAQPSSDAPAPTVEKAPVDSFEPSDVELAKAIQYGSQEEAAKALAKLKTGGKAVTPDQVMNFVTANIGPVIADQLDFRGAVDFVKTEYSDLMANDYLRRLFFSEEQRRRTPREQGGEGDTRSYKELYKAIGDDLRKGLNLSPPTKTPATPATKEERQAAKEKAPTVPKLAAVRLEGKPPAKPLTQVEIINKMRAARGQHPL